MVPPEPPGPIVPSIVSIEPELPIDARAGCVVTLSSGLPVGDESKYRWLADISPFGVVQSVYDNYFWIWQIDDFYMEGFFEDDLHFSVAAMSSGHTIESINLIAIGDV